MLVRNSKIVSKAFRQRRYEGWGGVPESWNVLSAVNGEVNERETGSSGPSSAHFRLQHLLSLIPAWFIAAGCFHKTMLRNQNNTFALISSSHITYFYIRLLSEHKLQPRNRFEATISVISCLQKRSNL